MAMLTSVPVALPEDKVPTKKMVRDIVGAFLTREWPSVDPDALVMSYHESFANAHCPIERPRPESNSPTEPLKVFVKFHKGDLADIEAFKHLVPSKQEEALICHEFGRSGMGARVHGVFKTGDGTLGRVDEFLDAHNLEPGDVENAAIRADVAKAMATFHTTTLPLRDKAVEPFYDALGNGLKKYHKMSRLKALGEEGGVSIASLVDYDFGPRLGKAVDRLGSMGAKLGWCIHDVQFMNTMVRNDATGDESKVALIDFEFVMRNYRAFDIGGHFMQKMFKWFDEESKIADCRNYTQEEKRHFCDEYARQWSLLTGDSESGNQVLQEAEYGYLLATGFDVHNMLCAMSEDGDKDPSNLLGLNRLFDEFVDHCAALGIDGPGNR